MIPFYEAAAIVILVGIESSMVVVRGWERRKWGAAV